MAAKGNRFHLKKKFVQIYEELLSGGEPWKSNDHFWDELFLLKVNGSFIKKEFEVMKPEKLLQLKPVINRIFAECIQAIKSDNRIRIANAYETLAAFIQAMFNKNRELDLGIDVIDLLFGSNVADASMKDLLEISCSFLEIPFPHSLKQLVLEILLVLVTASETVSNNVLVEFLMTTSVFEALMTLLSDGVSRQKCGYQAVLLLTLIVNYRKYESTNPYIMKLSIADNELALNGFGQVIACTLYEYNRRFVSPGARETTALSNPSGSLLSGLTSWVGGIFTPVSSPIDLESSLSDEENYNKRCDATLLAMYEAVHLNRNFFTVLTNTQPESIDLRPVSPPLTPTSPTAEASEKPKTDGHNTDLHEPPTNLFVTFIEFVSIVMQNTKEESSFHTTKLCFINLTCIAEDQYANSIMHDINMQYKVVIHHAPMRHRKLPSTRDCPSRPLAAAVLDLMVEFVLCNMRKNFHLDLYVRCLGIVHRLLCYQKRYRVRLLYPWKELWSALISLLKFILANEVTLAKRCNIFIVCSQIVNIINLFITYGDTFLASPPSYDELYYEIIRCNQVFDNLYSTALRYASCDTTTSATQWRESAARLASHLVNIRAIVNHFNPKINSWATANGLSSLMEAQVLEVVRGNYDSLTLKLHDNLDQFERYSEKPRETPFFVVMVKSILEHVRKESEKDQHQLIQEQMKTATEVGGVR